MSDLNSEEMEKRQSRPAEAGRARRLYALDALDRANVYGIGTVMENNPTFRLFLDEAVREDKLRAALGRAFECFPYMRSRLILDGIYTLEDNPEPFPIHHCRFENRPLRFGKNAGGYLFQLSYDENELIFDWAHIATDGLGFLQFVKAVLAAYYDVELCPDSALYTALPVEAHYDRHAGRSYIKPQTDGFDQDRLPHSSPLGSAHCTTLSVPAQEILTYRNRVDATPAAILSALIAETFRARLKEKEDSSSESNDVRGKIVVSTRKTLGVDTLHNCYLNLFVTYTDAFEKFDFSTVCTIYRAFIDLAVEESSVLRDIRDRRETLALLEEDPDQAAVRENAKAHIAQLRKNYCNFNFSYLGVLPFGEEIMAHLVDFQGICLNENCEFGVFAYSFNDRIYLTVCENYLDEDMLSRLIALGEKLDIHFERKSEMLYRQAYLEI